MSRRGVLTALALLVFLAGPAVLARQSAPARTLAESIAAALDRNHVPGAVAVVVSPARTDFGSAFGLADLSTRRPMSRDAIFRIASMTKPVTSVAAMQLVETGRIGLDDPVAAYLPELKDLMVFESFDAATGGYTVRRAARPVTVRHLFTHTSGLGYTFTSATLRDFRPRDGESYPAGPLLFEPGERWHYGTSTDWLGRLVERVSKQTLDAYFSDHIFRPLRMNSTFFNVPADQRQRLVTIHRHESTGGFVVQAPAPPLTVVTEFNGGGGLFSTGDDYGRFLRMLLNKGELEGARLLSSTSVAAMLRDQIGGRGVPALTTALPDRSADFLFINDRRDGWGLGFLITAAAVPGKRSTGSVSWGGINNTHFWLDPARNVAGILLMQFLPFADHAALDALDGFERAVYESLSANN
jgi:CubicO group peptidase (beta-lactamase class C family)